MLSRLLPLMAVFAFIVSLAPAAAAPFCHGGSSSGIGYGYGLSFGGGPSGIIRFTTPRTEEEQARLDLATLRRLGVDATRVERWNGCMRAFVRQPGGGVRMEFYDPITKQRVQ